MTHAQIESSLQNSSPKILPIASIHSSSFARSESFPKPCFSTTHSSALYSTTFPSESPILEMPKLLRNKTSFIKTARTDSLVMISLLPLICYFVNKTAESRTKNKLIHHPTCEELVIYSLLQYFTQILLFGLIAIIMSIILSLFNQRMDANNSNKQRGISKQKDILLWA